MNWFEDHLLTPLIILIGVLAVSFLILIGYSAYRESNSPTFELHKNEWVCTQSHVQVFTTLIQSGKVLIPYTTSITICDNYHRALQ